MRPGLENLQYDGSSPSTAFTLIILAVSNQFVNRAIDNDAFLVGNGLRSCTSEIQVSPELAVDGHPVILIDTPGFNDTVMKDIDVLKEISAFLATVCVISSFY